ncbi:MAG: ATP-binding protein [Clostridia bacterium]|jgi:tRNA(Ile)-lysidine synthase TilS/MesJ
MESSKLKRTLKHILGGVRKAIEDFSMLKTGDHIAVGVSGGKDSLTLLNALNELKKYGIYDFNLSAITVDMGFSGTSPDYYSSIEKFCTDNRINFFLETTSIASIVFSSREEKNPCSLCSNMRRGALANKCREIGANILALGHHKEDLVDTFLMSLFYENRLNTYQPVTYMDRSEITVIRPLLYVEEADILFVSNYLQLPLVESACPINKKTKREEIKLLLKEISHTLPNARDSIFSAIMHPDRASIFREDKSDKENSCKKE